MNILNENEPWPMTTVLDKITGQEKQVPKSATDVIYRILREWRVRISSHDNDPTHILIGVRQRRSEFISNITYLDYRNVMVGKESFMGMEIIWCDGNAFKLVCDHPPK